MKVGLIQVDGDLPNLALMRISRYYEDRGDTVEWYKGNLFEQEYGEIYASQIFSFSQLPAHASPLPPRAQLGGTGIDFKNRLPDYIDQLVPSYTLYPECTYHVGMSMKGCRYRCAFCCVPQKEGKPTHQSTIDELLINPRGGNRLMLLDNDFFGSKTWKENILRIIELKLRVCFAQGINIRIITPEQAGLLAQCNYQNVKFHEKYLTFAWDRVLDRKHIMKGIQTLNAAGIPNNKMQFFILIGYDTTHAENLDRVTTLRDLGCMPFVMPYKKDDPYQAAFARWVNHRATFKSCTWEEYKYRVNE